ncbi:DUF6879 family protein [Gordonia sp. NPDC003504]
MILSSDAVDIDPWDSVTREAFRFEGLPSYGSNEFDERFREFIQTGKVEQNDRTSWSQEVADMTESGISVKRLRAVSIPNSDYERYELEAGYRPGVLAGEDIRVCERNKIDGRFPDFWLFDDKYIQVLDYDESGAVIGMKNFPADDYRQMIDQVRKVFNESRSIEF